MKFTSFLFFMFLLASQQVFADYFVDVRGDMFFGGGSVEGIDYRYDTDHSGFSLYVTGFLDSVDVEGVPVQEAGFLSKNSSLSFSLVNIKTEVENGFEMKEEMLTLEGVFVFPSKVAFLVGGISKGQDGGSVESNLKNMYLEAGYYIFTNGAFSVRYSEYEDSLVRQNFLETDSWGVDYYQVQSVGNDRYVVWSLGLEKSKTRYSESLKEDELALLGGVKFYFSNRFGIGVDVGASGIDSENYDGNRSVFYPNMTYDIGEAAGVYLNASSNSFNIEYDQFDGEYKESSLIYTLGINIRI